MGSHFTEEHSQESWNACFFSALEKTLWYQPTTKGCNCDKNLNVTGICKIKLKTINLLKAWCTIRWNSWEGKKQKGAISRTSSVSEIAELINNPLHLHPIGPGFYLIMVILLNTEEVVVKKVGSDLWNKGKLQISQVPPYLCNQIPSECFFLVYYNSILEPVKHELSYNNVLNAVAIQP